MGVFARERIAFFSAQVTQYSPVVVNLPPLYLHHRIFKTCTKRSPWQNASDKTHRLYISTKEVYHF